MARTKLTARKAQPKIQNPLFARNKYKKTPFSGSISDSSSSSSSGSSDEDSDSDPFDFDSSGSRSERWAEEAIDRFLIDDWFNMRIYVLENEGQDDFMAKYGSRSDEYMEFYMDHMALGKVKGKWDFAQTKFIHDHYNGADEYYLTGHNLVNVRNRYVSNVISPVSTPVPDLASSTPDPITGIIPYVPGTIIDLTADTPPPSPFRTPTK